MIFDSLQYDMKRFRMDVSTHPFTETMGLNDVRITTRYEGTDFKKSISSTIHEAGHALYNLQCDKSLSVTPLEGGFSLALHESQSRFWENIVGRSLPFVQLIAPLITKQVSFANQATDDELYLYFNNVNADYIRVDADEVTYNLHIALRYEIEKKNLGDDPVSLRFLNSGTIEWSSCLECDQLRIHRECFKIHMEQWPLWLFPNLHFGQLGFSYNASRCAKIWRITRKKSGGVISSLSENG